MSDNTIPMKKAYIILDQNMLKKDTSDHKQFNCVNLAYKVASMGYEAQLDIAITSPDDSTEYVNADNLISTIHGAKDADVWYFPAGWEESDKCVIMHEIARALRKETLEEVSASTPAV